MKCTTKKIMKRLVLKIENKKFQKYKKDVKSNLVGLACRKQPMRKKPSRDNQDTGDTPDPGSDRSKKEKQFIDFPPGTAK